MPRRERRRVVAVEDVGPYATRALVKLEPGQEIAVLGPLGNGFRLDVPRPLLVGGGRRCRRCATSGFLSGSRSAASRRATTPRRAVGSRTSRYERLVPRLARSSGGYSGPGLRPIALAAVYACRRATRLPIVGMGGVCTGRDALELIACGASQVALGTVLFGDPDAPARVRVELAEEAARAGFGSAEGAVGAAHEAVVKVSN